MIWHKSDGVWCCSVFAPGWDGQNNAKAAQRKSPIIMILEDQHNQWLHAPNDAKCPKQWLGKTALMSYQSYRGSARSQSTPSVHTMSSATPSVHTQQESDMPSHALPTRRGVVSRTHVETTSGDSPRHPDGKAEHQKGQTSYVWTCNLCKASTRQKNMRKLTEWRSNHIAYILTRMNVGRSI